MPQSKDTKPGFTLRTIIFLAALVASGLIIFLGLKSHQNFRDQAVAQYQENQLNIARSAAQGMENELLNLRNQLNTLAQDPRVLNVTSEGCQDALVAFFQSNKNYVYASYRIDKAFHIADMYPPDDNAMDADISGQAHMRELKRTGRLVVSGRFQAVEGFDAVTIHAPVYRKGRLDGSVATLVSIDQIEKTFIAPIRSGRRGYGWLVDDTGVIVSHPDPKIAGTPLRNNRRLFGTKKDTEPLVRSILAGKSGAGHFGDMLAAYTPIHFGGRSWTVVVTATHAEIAGPITANYRNTITFTGLVLVLVFVAVYWILRSSQRAAELERREQHLEEKIALQDELRQSRDRLDTIIKTMPSGLFTIDPEQTILTWNETAERITGYSAKDVVGSKCSIFHAAPCNRRCGLFAPSVPKPIIGAECAIQRKDGSIITISKNVDYFYTAAGDVAGGIESFIDITEEKAAEQARIDAIALEKEVEQLRKMDEVKTNFLSMVSHELRTPLSVILGNLTLALRGRFGDMPTALRGRLETIQKRAGQLNLLIENLLNLTRLETGKLDVNKETLDLPASLHEALGALHSDIDGKNIVVEQNLAPEAGSVFADRNMLHQVLTNVLGNAVKFTPEDGVITITTTTENRVVAVRVADTGPGIPEDALPRVFERFFQADNSPTRSYGGTGLGLAIVKEIIDLHKGEISIRNLPGGGTELFFTLPLPETPFLDEQQEADLAPAVTSAPEPQGKPCKILLVDDDVDFLNMMCDIFENTRFHVISSNSTLDGLECLRNERPALILLDLRMSGKDGWFFLDIVHRDEKTSDIPVIVLSASVDQKHKDRARELGAAAFLTKPVSPDEMFDTIDHVLGDQGGQ